MLNTKERVQYTKSEGFCTNFLFYMVRIFLSAHSGLGVQECTIYVVRDMKDWMVDHSDWLG